MAVPTPDNTDCDLLNCSVGTPVTATAISQVWSGCDCGADYILARILRASVWLRVAVVDTDTLALDFAIASW